MDVFSLCYLDLEGYKKNKLLDFEASIIYKKPTSYQFSFALNTHSLFFFIYYAERSYEEY